MEHKSSSRLSRWRLARIDKKGRSMKRDRGRERGRKTASTLRINTDSRNKVLFDLKVIRVS